MGFSNVARKATTLMVAIIGLSVGIVSEAGAPVNIVSEVDETVYVTASALNVRSGPDTDYDKVGKLSNRASIRRTGITDNGWSRVDYNGTVAYVSSQYVTTEEPAAAPAVVATTGSTDLTGLVFDGSVSSACQAKAISLYSCVPQNVKNAIVNSGYQVIVSSNPWWTEGHAGTFYPFDSGYAQGNAIAIYAGSVGKVNIAVVHEIGHFIDNYIGRRDGYGTCSFGYQAVTSTSEWQEIYAAERGASGFPSYATDCAEDYFAECVWKALVSPGWCSTTIPRSYEYAMRFVNAC